MAFRQQATATVRLHSPGTIYTTAKSAWSYYIDASDLWDLPADYSKTKRIDSGHDLADHTSYDDDLQFTEGLNVVRLNGFTSGVDKCLQLWTYSLETGGTVEQGYLPNVPGLGKQVSKPGVLTSVFSIGRDAWWELSLWRSKPVVYDLWDVDHTYDKGTTVRYGDPATIYTSLVSSNLGSTPPSANWEVQTDATTKYRALLLNPNTYVTWGEDIAKGAGWRIWWSRGGPGPVLQFWSQTLGRYDDGISLSGDTHVAEGELLHIRVGITRGQITIINMRERLGRDTQVNTFRRPGDSIGYTNTAGQTIAGETMREGPIKVENQWGEWFLQWRPVVFTTGTLEGMTKKTGLITTGRTQVAEDTYLYSIGGQGVDGGGAKTPNTSLTPWTSTEPTWETDAEAKKGTLALAVRRAIGTGLPEDGVQWKIRFEPYWFRSNGTGYDVKTYATPELCSFSIWQRAQLTNNGLPAVQSDLTALGLVKSVSYDMPEDFSSAQATIRMQNRFHETRGILPFQILSLTDSGWYRGDATTEVIPIGDGTDVNRLDVLWALEPRFNGHESEMVGLDILSQLGMMQAETDIAGFGGWKLGGNLPGSGAIAFLLEAHGVGTDLFDLEDIGAYLVEGSWDQPTLAVQRGRTVLDYIREIVDKCGQHAALWSDRGVIKLTCPYCGTKRTAANWQQHLWYGWNRAGSSSQGCWAADIARSGNADGVDLEVYLTPQATPGFDPDAISTGSYNYAIGIGEPQHSSKRVGGTYANYISVQGEGKPEGSSRKKKGRTYTARDQNDAEIALCNRYIPHIETDHALKTQAEVNYRVAMLGPDLATGYRWVTVPCIFEPRLRRGKVVRFWCDSQNRQGLHETKWRVVSATHQLVYSDVSTTTLTARYMGA